MNPNRVKSILVGSYLGDGTITKQRSKNGESRLQIQHSIKQFEYAKWKSNLLPNFFTEPKIYNRTFKNKPYKFVIFHSKVHPFCTRMRKLYDNNGHKRINNSIISYLDDLGLAIWYMDDGNLSLRRKKNINGIPYSYLAGSKLAVCDMNDNELEIIQELLSRKFNLITKIYKTWNKYPVLWMNMENTKKLISIISKYVPECMVYKIDLQRETPLKNMEMTYSELHV